MYEGEAYELDSYDVSAILSQGAPAALHTANPELIHSWAVSPEGHGSVDCAGVFKVNSNLYYSFEAWCDTTGWDCQAAADFSPACPSVLAAVHYLSQESRRRLGFEHSIDHGDIYRG